MIPTSPVGVLIYTSLYALICAAILLRVITFNCRGGKHRHLPALLAWLLASAAGSVPLRFLLFTLPVPDPVVVVMAAFLLCALLKTRGSLYRLLPHRQPAEPANRARRSADLCRRYQP